MDEAETQPVSALAGARSSAPYFRRPPSPPFINVPTISHRNSVSVQIAPSFDNADDPVFLSREELQVVTQGRAQVARDRAMVWRYEHRRRAQLILDDWLYLGPSNVARDEEFLRGEGITMLLGARDARLAAARLMSVEKATQRLGIEVAYMDVESIQDLSRNFDAAVRIINDHMLRVYRCQAAQGAAAAAAGAAPGNSDVQGGPEEGEMVTGTSRFRRGKVLVFCETGNDRSAAIVAAYIMNVFGEGLISTLQFVGLQRFCANFDDETKRWLSAYGSILEARREVARARREQSPTPTRVMVPRDAAGAQTTTLLTTTTTTNSSSSTAAARTAKRSIDDTMDEGEDDAAYGGDVAQDVERFGYRSAFAPFVSNADVAMGDA